MNLCYGHLLQLNMCMCASLYNMLWTLLCPALRQNIRAHNTQKQHHLSHVSMHFRQKSTTDVSKHEVQQALASGMRKDITVDMLDQALTLDMFDQELGNVPVSWLLSTLSLEAWEIGSDPQADGSEPVNMLLLRAKSVSCIITIWMSAAKMPCIKPMFMHKLWRQLHQCRQRQSKLRVSLFKLC